MREIGKDSRQMRQRLFVIHKLVRPNIALGEDLQRATYVDRRVMEAGSAGDF